MIVYLFAIVIVIIAAVLAFGIAALLHLEGLAYAIFVPIILLVGIVAGATIVILHHRSKKLKALEGDPDDSSAKGDLDLLVDEANRKLRGSQQKAKTLENFPLIYILGDRGSAKTTTVLQSGLEPELLAGSVSNDGAQDSPSLLNLWYTRSAAFLEVGTAILQSKPLLARLVNRTRATAYRSAFGAGAPPRAAVVCVSADQLLLPQGTDAFLGSARSAGAQLREISRSLGLQIPVYVIVTKLDRVPHFEEYVRNLTDDEVRQVLGVSLARLDSSAGTYSDQASRNLSGPLDSLVFKLAGFRIEMLQRENEPAKIQGVYEFPREFGKLRKSLNQYLVELCKPSQLNANPYLRGLYFTGVRARIVEHIANPPASIEVPVAMDAGATQFLNLSKLRAESASQKATPDVTASRVPQWAFLPRLLPEAILGDKGALASTLHSAPARLFRRILFGTMAFVFALFTILICISYSRNAALVGRIREDARALPTANENSSAIPNLTDLRNLDDLRQVIVQLDDFERNGRPLAYRFGLYQGGKLTEGARQIYFNRFRSMFLHPAQSGFVQYLRALPDAPQATSDITSYLATYNPLKAYLITTNHPEKSQAIFLTPIFLQYWKGERTVDMDQEVLAKKQIDFYSDELLRKPPYAIEPDTALIEHTRFYLSKFLANTRIYQSMLSDADKKNPRGIDFGKEYPDAVHYVSDSHVIRGAYTSDGFAIMQNALQHPERYAQAESWVLGNQGGSAFDIASISKELSAEYSADYLKEWRQFLTSAHVAPCGGVKDAPKELAALSGTTSPILELFWVISHNTAVSDPQIKDVFQPVQAMVNPNATDRLIGEGINKDYITALGNLGLNLEQALAQNPQLASDPAAFAQISQAVITAKSEVQKAAQSFNIDKDAHTERIVAGLMSQPIDCVSRLQPSPGAQANGAGAKICEAINPLLGKFPFANTSTLQATLPEVDAAFAPETGLFWTTYATSLRPFLTQTGSQSGALYKLAPNAPQALNPQFVGYFNRGAHVSNTLYPAGQRFASFTFTLRFLPGNGVLNGSLVVDGQRIQSGSGVQQFTWNGKTANSASLSFDGHEALAKTGTWALFELVRKAQVTHTPTGYHLEYRITDNSTVAGEILKGGAVKSANFELSGAGADLLVGEAFMGLSCVRPVIK